MNLTVISKAVTDLLKTAAPATLTSVATTLTTKGLGKVAATAASIGSAVLGSKVKALVVLATLASAGFEVFHLIEDHAPSTEQEAAGKKSVKEIQTAYQARASAAQAVIDKVESEGVGDDDAITFDLKSDQVVNAIALMDLCRWAIGQFGSERQAKTYHTMMIAFLRATPDTLDKGHQLLGRR